MSGYWPGPWSGEDGGPERLQVPAGGVGVALGTGVPLEVVSRTAPAATMAVTRDPGELFLLRHTAGQDAISFVERIDPVTLAPLGRSPDLAGGPTWPGSLAAHANGSLYVVFGNHAHRLGPDLVRLAGTALPRHRPYNGFVILPDGHLVTKDFAGSRPGVPVAADERQPCELVVLEPDGLHIVDRLHLAEPSVARLSAQGDDIYVVGDTSLLRVRWDGRLRPTATSGPPTAPSTGRPTAGTACWRPGPPGSSTTGRAASSTTGRCTATARSTAPLHLVRIDLATGAVVPHRGVRAARRASSPIPR